MSGKGRFTKKGQGKGKNQTKGGNSSATGASKKQFVTDFSYYLGSAKQASDYETTTEFLINYIKKLYDYGNDIDSSALETLEPVDTSEWKPTMRFSTNKDAAVQKNEDRQFEIEFKADYDTYSKRLQPYENNRIKAYALLWERCAKAMKNKIESRADYNKIRNDPILLLKALKEHALNYQENRYSMSMILDAMRTVLGTRQKEGNNQYPKTVTESNNVLSNHRFDAAPKTQGKGKGQNEGNKSNKEKEESKDNEEEVNLSFAQMEGKCYCCGKAGHKSPSCRDKSKPKEEWAINRAQQSDAQAAASSDASAVASVTVPLATPPRSESSGSHTGWAGAHIKLQFHQQAEDMRDWILLDNQSSVTIFCNKDLVENIRESKTGNMYLSTNGGLLVTKHKADLPQWGEVWFNENAITNIFSYAEMADRYRITYDSTKDDAFVVHLPNKSVRYERIGNNLYVYKPPRKESSQRLQLLNMVEENTSFYTQRQFNRAKRARDLYHALGTPSIEDFKSMLRMNTVANNPVTTEDIKIAELIFGHDIGDLKGKTTRRKPFTRCERLY